MPVKVNYQVYQSGTGELISRYSDSSPDQGQGHVQEPIVSESTPFFHVDLVAAVRAAKKLGLREEDEQSESGESGPSGSSQSDILIDLHN